jgi:Dolichyl-phosphate-mannose-protein mannosyltransferase
MKVLSRITVIGLLALTAVVLLINVHYLYTTPVANTDTWWCGDETWLMGEYHHFITTGHYSNPFAPGSVFSLCTGLLFGSCYVTAALYGLPLLFIQGHTVDAGRTLTWIFGVLTLFAVWKIAKRYHVGMVARAYGCLLLAGTVCFFITSHSARPDMLVGLTLLLCTGCLPLLAEKPFPNRDVFLGFLLPFGFLVNGHVTILSFLTIGYIAWMSGIFKSKKLIFRMTGAAVVGFVLLFLVQEALLGSASLYVGPLSGGTSMMPLAHFLHPKTDIADVNARIAIATTWASGMLSVFVVLVAALVWAHTRYKARIVPMEPAHRRLLASAALVVLSSMCLEFYWPRYLIFVLPTIVLSFLIVIAYLVRALPRASVAALSAALSVCMAFALWQYEADTAKLGAAGEFITASNTTAVTDALAAIHARRAGMLRIFSTVPGENIAMDDSCTLITPVMYVQPIDTTMSPKDLWNAAKIDYAIVCIPAHGSDDWRQTDVAVDPSARSRARVIFERLGAFSDIRRSNDPSDLKNLDTLRVYEF